MSNTLPISRRSILGGMAAIPFLSSPVLASTSKVNRIMVQGRPQDSGGPYKVAKVMTALDALGGVRKMRCREPFSGTIGWNTYVGLARAGVKFCFTLSVRNISTTIADLKSFLSLVPGSIWAIEGPNEPDLNPVTYNGVKDARLGFRTGNAPALMAYLRDVTAALQVDPVLRNIPFIASNDYMQAEQASFSDYGNNHIYPKPNGYIPTQLNKVRTTIAAGGHSEGVITEWGRTTGGGDANATAKPVTLEQQATLLASDIRQALAQPFIKVFSIYELLSWGGTSEMNNFGIFEADGTPRPAVAAIRAVITA